MKIENHYLHYYKTEADGKDMSASLGGVSLETIQWVRPYDNAPGTLFHCLRGRYILCFCGDTKD